MFETLFRKNNFQKWWQKAPRENNDMSEKIHVPV